MHGCSGMGMIRHQSKTGVIQTRTPFVYCSLTGRDAIPPAVRACSISPLGAVKAYNIACYLLLAHTATWAQVDRLCIMSCFRSAHYSANQYLLTINKVVGIYPYRCRLRVSHLDVSSGVGRRLIILDCPMLRHRQRCWIISTQ